MKKGLLLIVIMLCALMAFCACGEGEKEPEATAAPTAAPTQAPTATPEPTAVPTATPEPTPVPTPAPTREPDLNAGGFASEEACLARFFPDPDSPTGLTPLVGTGKEIATQFHATTSFNAIGFRSPTWTYTEGYGVIYYLYEWLGDYDSTMDEDPILESDNLEGWPDGTVAKWEFADGTVVRDGEYLLVAEYYSTQSMSNSGIWYKPIDFTSTKTYVSGVLQEEMAALLDVFYTKTPNNLYGPLTLEE